jgi:hypothetical protein
MVARWKFNGPQRVNQAEAEVKVEQRPDSFFLSLNLNLNLPDRLADFSRILFGLWTESKRAGSGGDYP